MVLWTSSILLREAFFQGYFTNIEPLRIGAGREAPLGSLTDLAVLRINYKGNTIPVIPGSSLKGNFRTAATMILKSMGFKACSGLAKETCMDTVVVDASSGKKLGDEIELHLRIGDSSKAMETFFENTCLLCKIFGAPSYASKVIFYDAYPLGENNEILPFSFSTRTGIAIDRKTGAVFGHALYVVEFVEPGANFKFSIMCKNLPNYALGLIATILNMLNSGELKIGGFKTRGFGAVRIEKLSVKFRDYPRSDKAVLKQLEDRDREVTLENLARLENGWLVAEDNNAWTILRKLEDSWYAYAKS